MGVPPLRGSGTPFTRLQSLNSTSPTGCVPRVVPSAEAGQEGVVVVVPQFWLQWCGGREIGGQGPADDVDGGVRPDRDCVGALGLLAAEEGAPRERAVGAGQGAREAVDVPAECGLDRFLRREVAGVGAAGDHYGAGS